MFPVFTVDPNAPVKMETMGTKRKFWFRHHELGFCLFKLARAGTGEDWSEKVAEQVCRLLGLPHARYELAVSAEGAGVITPSFVPDSDADRLLPGNELLTVQPGYQPSGNNYRNSSHTLDLVMATLGLEVRLPPGWQPPEGVRSAADVFVGYLMLDAWIGNTDRHHENWALVEQSVEGPPRQTTRYLAPTHDHASCLGCHETDEKRQEHLTTRDSNHTLAAYARKAKSALYRSEADKKPMTTLDAFRTASRLHPVAGRAWLERLSKITPLDGEMTLRQIPIDRISKMAAEFAAALLAANQRRLLDEN